MIAHHVMQILGNKLSICTSLAILTNSGIEIVNNPNMKAGTK